MSGWPLSCHDGIEDGIASFRRSLPGWWYSLGECQVSCDASCAPTSESPDLELIPMDERFDSGFHVDLPQPATLADALRHVMREALAAKAIASGGKMITVKGVVGECICGTTPCSGLNCGPFLPGHVPRKKPAPKSPAELSEIRARAWATRRAKYGKDGHR